MNDIPKIAIPTQTSNVPVVQEHNGFNVDMHHAIEGRDNELIASEIVHGAISKEFVYSFPMKGGKKVTGISVVGAAHLANKYQGIKSRIIATCEKRGALFTFKSYDPMDLRVQTIPELLGEEDFYEVVMEISDVKTGNSIQVRKSELRTETDKKGNPYVRPHFATIAESKAYRNGVLRLVPQDVQMLFLNECIAKGDNSDLTESAIQMKRKGLLNYCLEKQVFIKTDVVKTLTFDQLVGLEQSSSLGDEAFQNSLMALDILGKEKPEQKVAKLPANKKTTDPKKAKTVQEEEPGPDYDPDTGEVNESDNSQEQETQDPQNNAPNLGFGE